MRQFGLMLACLLLGLLAVRQVGENQTHGLEVFRPHRIRGQGDRDARAVGCTQGRFSALRSGAAVLQERTNRRLIGRADACIDGRAYQALQRGPEHRRQAAVGV